MFGSAKPVVLERYGHRRSRWRPPRWLVLLLLGVAAGAASVIVAQERYLPPRLSAGESAQLRGDLDTAQADRTRLSRALDDTTARLNAALAEKKTLTDDLSATRARVDRLRDDLAVAVAGLPPDPRGGTVAVRAGRFGTRAGALTYELVLTRDRVGGPPLNGALAFTVEGDGGAPQLGGTVSLKPIALSVSAHEVARGSVALPEGFRPRQVTIRVLAGAGSGNVLGMRVLPVK